MRTSAQDSVSGQVARTCEQETVVAAFRHGTSRNLDPALYAHSEIANTVQGTDAKWGTIANESLLTSRMLLGTRREQGVDSMNRSDRAGQVVPWIYFGV